MKEHEVRQFKLITVKQNIKEGNLNNLSVLSEHTEFSLKLLLSYTKYV
jgi:hypothetical protein